MKTKKDNVMKLKSKHAIKNANHQGKDRCKSATDLTQSLVATFGGMLDAAEDGDILSAAITIVNKDKNVRNIVILREDCQHQLISGSVYVTQRAMRLSDESRSERARALPAVPGFRRFTA
jgi:hypothetical protein